ncbi:MAG: hypothetical protein N2517_08645 [Ignavibacteria bacterium]|nr:hypothetical protein [Ignavibacteria bacterium]
MFRLIFESILLLLRWNYFFIQKFRLARTSEELAILSVFVLSFFFSCLFASLLLFAQVESLLKLDIEILVLIFYLLISSFLLKVVFQKRAYLKYFSNLSFSRTHQFCFTLVWLVMFLVLGIALAYDFTKGDFSILIEYLKAK